MRKFLLAGVLAFCFTSVSRADPLDVPYQILVDTVGFGVVTLSTSNFASPVGAINNGVLNSKWCVDHVVVSGGGSPVTFTMAWSTGPTTLTNPTTDYVVVTTSGVPYDSQWPYRDPYCAPTGQAILQLRTSGVTTSTITVQGYLWKGWNP